MDRVNSVQELIERTAGMPLERMRFFIGEDRQEPKCFGIYHDEAEDRWVVYKNKADGSRAVRYSGPDEAYAANEIWMKIQSEIDIRRPKKRDPKRARREAIINGALFALLAALVLAFLAHEYNKPSRGYYRVDDDLYYYQDDAWYFFDDGGWDYYDAPDGEEWYADSYYGDSYPYFDDASDAFESSEYYEEPDSSDDDDDNSLFDSWDSGDTDRDSDW